MRLNEQCEIEFGETWPKARSHLWCYPQSSSHKQLPLLHFTKHRGRLAVISAVQARGHSGSTELAVTMPKKRCLAHSISTRVLLNGRSISMSVLEYCWVGEACSKSTRVLMDERGIL